MVKVSVIVPVYNPGSDFDECVASLLGQSMPAGECELIFVDDGSTDATPERLDALAAEHDHVRVEHIPNSGWPGRPRNIGIDMARGEYIYFVDNDDWLGDEALERLHAAALADDADVVIGKIVGQGKYVARGMFGQNRRGLTARNVPLGILTPHKLFRRALLEEHRIRFPEGRRRLEDHVMVMEAFFRARRISVLADYACYHWVLRDRDRNASYQRPAPADYYAAVREVLDIVDAHTEPGELRDQLYMHWYGGKLLRRIGGGGFAALPADERQAWAHEVRTLIDERFPAALDARLPYALRLRADLVRRGSVDGLATLAAYESSLGARARVRWIRGDGTWLSARCNGRLRVPGQRGFEVVRRGDRLHWAPPEAVRALFSEPQLDVTDELDDGDVQVFLRSLTDATEWELLVDGAPWLPDEPDGEGEALRPRFGVRARLAPTIGAGGAPLPPGEYEVMMNVALAGFSAVGRVRSDEAPWTVTITPALRVESSLPTEPPPPPPPPPPGPATTKQAALRTALAVPGLVPQIRRVRALARR